MSISIRSTEALRVDEAPKKITTLAGSHLRTALISAVTFLTFLGLISIYTSSSMKGLEQFGDAFLFLRKQAFVAMIGFAFIVFSKYLSIRAIERATLPLLCLTLVILSLILVPGFYSHGNGAARWVNLIGFRFQPAELAKLALVLFLAKNLARKSSDLKTFAQGILPNILVFGLFALFIMKQPDFGSTVLLGTVTFAMLFAGGLPVRYILWSVVAALIGVITAVAIAPYRLARLTSFLNPWAEIKHGGFQIIQSYLAFQNGGLFGLGLGESKQKLYFLPEAHTDFILSVIGEELGLLGVGCVALLFMFITMLGFRIANGQPTPYRRFLAFGLTSLIAIQAAFNMGVTMGMLPTKGIPLPFVSSGNSCLLVFLVVAGILARLSQDIAIPNANESIKK